jgi:hypothetical protein
MLLASLSVVVILALSQLSAAASALNLHEGTAKRRATSSPSQWDPRILPLVRFVEHARGLRFKHPVPVVFLSDSAFNNEARSGSGSPSASDRAQLAAAAGTLRSVGLADVDSQALLNSENTLSAATTDAFYDSDRKEIFVRGTSLDLATQVTTAHELTHVLQDQYFDLNALGNAASHRGTEEADAITSLIEGDAVNVENSFVSSLSQSQQDIYYANQNERSSTVEGGVSGNVPAILQALSQAPYDIGPAFVQAMLKNGGESRLNHAFTSPPQTDADILNPARFLTSLLPVPVRTPQLARGERRVESQGSLGAVLLYFVLSARLDPGTALKASDAWNGDGYVRFVRGGVQCLRLTVAGRNGSDSAALSTALTAWASRGPSGRATTKTTRAGVTLESCDPGSSALPSDGQIMNASATLAERATLLDQAIGGGLKPTAAICAANLLVADPTIASLSTVVQPTQQQIDEFGTKAEDAARACGA